MDGGNAAEIAAYIDATIGQFGLHPDVANTYWAIVKLCSPDGPRGATLECHGDYFTPNQEIKMFLLGDPDADPMEVMFLGAAMQPAYGAGVPLRRTGKFCSFAGDTHVLMADGTTKPIAEIEVGDQVLATDPVTGEQSPQAVTAVWVHEDTLIDLLLLLPTPHTDWPTHTTASSGQFASITTTTDHPFWNHTTQQWQPADTLPPGHQLLTPHHQHPTITGLLHYTAHTNHAYNLTITKLHTYYVLAGDTPVLVHNTGPFCGVPFGKKTPGDADFHGSDYSLNEMTEFVYGHTGGGNPAMGRPGRRQIEDALRNAGPVRLKGQNAAKFEYNGVRVIINYDMPWKSTAYFPGR